MEGKEALFGAAYDPHTHTVTYNGVGYGASTDWLVGVFQRTEEQIQKALGIDYAPEREAAEAAARQAEELKKKVAARAARAKRGGGYRPDAAPSTFDVKGHVGDEMRDAYEEGEEEA
jgi:3-deoxy-D-arabino-heptulosonate 7-phosphate (DAHP) synthase